jgi:hypothetical protein
VADDIIGSVAIEVHPSARDFVRRMRAEIEPGAGKLGDDIGKQIGDAAAARLAVKLRAGLDDAFKGGSPATQGSKQGGDFAGGFVRAVKARIDAAARSLPKLTLDANSTPAERRIAELRAELDGLSKKKIGVDLSDKDALAAMGRLQLELEKLQRGDHSIRVRVDAGAAAVELAALKAELASLGNGPGGGSAGGGGGSAGGGGLALPSLPITALLAALPLIGPLAGAAAGGLGALAGAGGAAGLAIKGLNNEIHAGTGLGQQLGGQLGSLKGILGTLESTAAHAASGGVLGALVELRGELPQLNPLVANIAHNLGLAGSISAHALITALQTATPLLEQGGEFAVKLAQGLDRAAGSGEFKSFIAYAQQELPMVGHFLQIIGQDAVGLVVVLAPIGNAFLDIGTAAGKALGDAEKFYNFLKGHGWNTPGSGDDPTQPKVPKVGSSIGTGGAGNPGSALFGGKSPSNFQKGGNLVFSGIIGIAEGNTLTSGQQNKQYAADNNKTAAQRKQDADLAANNAAAHATLLHQQNLTAAATIHEAQVLGVSVAAYRIANTAISDNATQLAATTVQMQRQNDASGLLKAALDKLDGKQLANAQAQNAFEQALVGMTTKIGRGDAALTGLSSSAVANRGELLNLVTAAETAAGTTGDLASSSVTAKKKLLELRQQVIDNAVAHGEDKAAVVAYLNSVLDVNKLHVNPTVFDISTESAAAKLADLKAAVTNAVLFIENQNPVLHVSTYLPAASATFGGRAAFADGGVVRGVGGPREDNQLILASVGERLIPNGPSQRYARLLDAMIAGHTIPGFADGGIVTLTPSKSSGAATAKAGSGGTIYVQDRTFEAHGGIVQAIIKEVQVGTPLAAAVMRQLGVAMTDAFDLRQLKPKLAAALANLKTLRDASAALASNITANIQQSFNPATAGADPSTGYVANFGNILSAFQGQGAKNSRFTAELDKLSKLGLNKQLLAQYAAAGPSQLLDVLANSSKAQIAQLNKAATVEQFTATRAGQVGAADVYASQIAAAQRLANHDAALMIGITKAMAADIRAIARETGKTTVLEVDGKVLLTAVQKAQAKKVRR